MPTKFVLECGVTHSRLSGQEPPEGMAMLAILFEKEEGKPYEWVEIGSRWLPDRTVVEEPGAEMSLNKIRNSPDVTLQYWNASKKAWENSGDNYSDYYLLEDGHLALVHNVKVFKDLKAHEG